MTEPSGAGTQPGATIAILAWWTIRDECRARSLWLLLAGCALLLVGFRGCAQASVVVNGATLDAATLFVHAAFHAITAGVLLVAGLRAMRLFHRERDDGTLAYLLARPVARWQYLAGKVAGLWAAAAASMFVLHGALGLLIFMQTHTVLPGLPLASLLCSLNLLLVVVAVLAFSLWLPDYLAFLTMLGIGIVSVIGHGIEAAAPLIHAALPPAGGPVPSTVSWWQLAWVFWPRIGGVEVAAAALIDGASGLMDAAAYPFVNVVAYCGLLAGLCYYGFCREDIV